MSHNILLIGAGQLGSRYLQGLSSTNIPLNITVFDRAPDALKLSRSRWFEVSGGKSQHQVSWTQVLPNCAREIDLVFVATTASGRAQLVDSVSKIAPVRYWVIEKVLAQSIAELEAIKASVSDSFGCWINTPRRMMTNYIRMKNLFRPHGALRVDYSGGLWGMATNSIHFIDLVSWWTGELIDSISAEGLDLNWFESKRPGYFELCGNLLVKFNNGSELMLSSSRSCSKKDFCVRSMLGSVWKIDEDSTTTYNKDNPLPGRLELQSEMTARLAQSILERGICELTPLSDSFNLHLPYIDAMRSHWNRCMKREDEAVPIT
jgi:hypothetical protein